jgi:hypothetical protein
MRTLLRCYGAAVACALALAAPGLRADEETGTLKGKVTFNGKPLPAGEVLFIDADGKYKTGTIREDGTYSVTGVKPGEYRIAVTTSKEKAPKGKYVPIPERFASVDHSGLKYQVQKGEQNFDISLKTEDQKPDPSPKAAEEKKSADKGAAERTTVQGKVTYKGKPLPNGVVVFKTDSSLDSSLIAADGSYVIYKPTLGLNKITVSTSKEAAGGRPFVPIPEKYDDPEKSGLTFKVQKGKNTFNIDLE